jgi:hypothetical protein
MRPRTLIALLGLALLAAAPVAADPVRHASNPRFDELMNWCASSEPVSTAKCLSYVAGVVDGQVAADAVLERPRLCYHTDQQRPALLGAVVAKLQERYSVPPSAAKLQNSPAAVVVVATLEEDFTCPLRAAAKFEVRGARSQPGAGLAEMHVRATNAKIYMASEALLTNEHLQKADVQNGPYGPQVLIRLTSEGFRLFRAWSGLNVGQPMAILVDNDLVAAPVIGGAVHEPHTRGLVIAGGFTRELAESLAHLINLTRLVSVRSQQQPAR